MKKLTIFLMLSTLALAGLAGNSCKDPEEKYPVRTIVGKRTLAGEIIWVRNPKCMSTITPCPPGGGEVLGLRTGTGHYTLSYDSHWYLNLGEGLVVEDVSYSAGDEVEITGIVSRVKLDESEEHIELEIETIRIVSERYI